MWGHRFVCLFIYLVLKHSYQGLVRDLDGNENKNINIDINISYKLDKYFDVVHNLCIRFLSVGRDLIPYPILHQFFENDSVLCFLDVVWKTVEKFCTTVSETSTFSS